MRHKSVKAILVIAAVAVTNAFGQNSKFDQATYNLAEVKAGATIGAVRTKGAPLGNAVQSAANGIFGSSSRQTRSAGPDANGVYHYDNGYVGGKGLSTDVDGFTELFQVQNADQFSARSFECRTVFHSLETERITTVNSALSGNGNIAGRNEDYVAPNVEIAFGRMWRIRDGNRSDTFFGFDGAIGGSWFDVDGGEADISGTVTKNTDSTVATYGREFAGPSLTTFPYTGTLSDGSGAGISGIPRVFLLPQTETFEHFSSTSAADISGHVKQNISVGVIYLDLGPRLDHRIKLGEKNSLVLTLRGGLEVAAGFASAETTGSFSYSVDGGPRQTRSLNDSESDADIAFRGYVGGGIGVTMGAREQWELGIQGKAVFGEDIKTSVADIGTDYTVMAALTYRWGGK